MSVLRAISPIDGSLLGEYTRTSPESLRTQMETAQLAGKLWAAVDVKTRCKILAKFKQRVLDNVDRICDCICQSTGKVRTEALLGEIYPLLDLITYYQKNAAQILRYQGVVTSPFAFPGATAGISRKPFGVVAVISPWNFPFQLAAGPMLSALFAGNAVILKASEFSLPVAHCLLDLFAQLDLPEGLVQQVIGDGDTGAALIDARPDLVFFTGGLATGRAVMQRAAQHPIPVMLELGGKDAMLVFADADLERACAAALYGAFSSSGQVCIAVERLYVEQSVYEKFVQLLVAATAELKVGHGDAGDLGTMTTERQCAIVEAHYQDAVAKGAQASALLQRQGNIIHPVILWNVSHDMRVMQEETFGPLLPVMAFADAAEAVRLANDHDFGLNASVWSQDLAKATQVAEQLQVGIWAINDVLKNAGHPALPFGGVKNSGFGRYHGAEGLRNFTYPVSGLSSRSPLPKEPNWFPYNATRYGDFKGYLDFVHGSGSLYQRIRRNWPALQAFREYSAFDLKQRWENFKLTLTRHRDL
jgi:acyl-CoA reductase-like NAD-dependent aldehyde dehydrogenase